MAFKNNINLTGESLDGEIGFTFVGNEKGELNFIGSENFKIDKTEGKDMKNGTVIKIVYGTGEKAFKALSNATNLVKEFSFNLKHKTETGIEGTILKYYMDSKTKVVYLDVEFEEEVAQRALELFIEDRFNQDSYFIYPVKNKDVANRFSNYVKENIDPSKAYKNEEIAAVDDTSLKTINDNNREREIKMENENKCYIYLVAESLTITDSLVYEEFLNKEIENLRAKIGVHDVLVTGVKIKSLNKIKLDPTLTSHNKFAQVIVQIELNSNEYAKIMNALGNSFVISGLLEFENISISGAARIEFAGLLRTLKLGECVDINSKINTIKTNKEDKERKTEMETVSRSCNINKGYIYLLATSISSLNILRTNGKASNEVFKEMLTESINNLNASISIADISISDIKVVNILDIKKEKHNQSTYAEVVIEVELNTCDWTEVVKALGNGYTTNGLLRLKNSTEIVAKLRSLRLGEATDIGSSLITKDMGDKEQESAKTDKCKMSEDEIEKMINNVIDEALIYTPHIYALPVLKTLAKADGLSSSVETRLKNEIDRRHMKQNFRKHHASITAPNPYWPNSWIKWPISNARKSFGHVSPGFKTVIELMPIAKFSNIEEAKNAVDDIRNNKILKNEDLILKENIQVRGKCLNVFITARENNTYVVQVVLEFRADIANKYRDLINSKKDESKLKTIDSVEEETMEEITKPIVTVQLLNPFPPFGKVNKEKIFENFMKEITEGKINLWLSYRRQAASTIATKIVDCKVSSFKPNPFSSIQLDCYTLQVQFQSSEEALDYLEHLKNNRQEPHFAFKRASDYPEYELLPFASIDYATSPTRTIRRNDENYRDYSSCNISITLGELNKSISEIKNRLTSTLKDRLSLKKEETMSLIFTAGTEYNPSIVVSICNKPENYVAVIKYANIQVAGKILDVKLIGVPGSGQEVLTVKVDFTKEQCLELLNRGITISPAGTVVGAIVDTVSNNQVAYLANPSTRELMEYCTINDPDEADFDGDIISYKFTDETGFETIADLTDNSKFSFEFFKSLIQKDEKYGEVIKLAIPTEKFKRLKDATEFHKSLIEYLEKSEHPIIERKLGNDYSAVFSKFYFIPTDFYLVERKEDEYIMFVDALIPADLISKFGEEEFTRICNNIMDESKLEFVERKDEAVDNKDITANEKNKKYPLTVYLPMVKFLTRKEANKLCKNINKSIKKIKNNIDLENTIEDDYVHLLPEIHNTENKEFHGYISKVEVVENHDGHFLVVANVKVSSGVKEKLGMKAINSIVINSINDVELADSSKHKKVVVDEVYTKDLKDYLYKLKTVGNDKLMISTDGYSIKIDNKVYDVVEISYKTIKDSNGIKNNKTKIIAKIVIE